MCFSGGSPSVIQDGSGDEMHGPVRVFAALLIAIGCAATGCGTHHHTHVTIGADAPIAPVDRPVHLTVRGLSPRETVTVSATATDRLQRRWSGRATVRADGHGTVDLERDRSTSGTYTGVDGMGLFWSMNPSSGDPATSRFIPPDPGSRPSYPVRITVTAHGRRPAERTLTRRWLGDGVTRRTFTVRADGFAGDLYLPPAGHGRHPAVLVFGGSEGGNSGTFEAALLASHGYPALSLAYFGEPGLPAELRNIPLDYFAHAARTLAAQPGVDPAHVVVSGYSRGSEAALLLGDRYPRLFHGVLVYSPSSATNPGYPGGGTAWTDHGRPIDEGQIPLDHVSGPLLSIAGDRDLLWTMSSSASSSRQIMTELDLDHDRYPHQALTFPGAGHAVGTFPYLAWGTRTRSALGTVDLGGSRAADDRARERGWPMVLAFLAAMER